MGFEGSFVGTSNDKVRIVLDADTANVTAGGEGRGGDLLVKDDAGRVTIRVNGGGDEGGIPVPFPGKGGADVASPVITIDATGVIVIRTADGEVPVAILRSRDDGDASGELVLTDSSGDDTVIVRGAHGDDASLMVGGGARAGWIAVRNARGNDTVFISGHEGAGLIELRDDAGDAALTARAVQGSDASLIVGGSSRRGWIVVCNAAGQDAVFITGHDGSDDAGVVELRDDTGVTTIALRAKGGAGWFGGQGTDGDVVVLPKEATARDTNQAAVWIRGSDGDIILRNADCAEDFDVDDDNDAEAGLVVALNDSGGIAVSDKPYDRRVAGVLSGAGGRKPGIVLGRNVETMGRRPVALSGTVFCRVDASYSPIRVGDLLTTSATRGHAMAARDQSQSFGAVLGKAMAPLDEGTDLIPVLVALQ